MQWRVQGKRTGRQMREEDGWANKGRGQVGRQGKRMGWEMREGDMVVQRHCRGRDRVIEYMNKSWTWTAFLCFISDFECIINVRGFQPAQELKLNSLNGEIEWGEWWVCPCSLAIQTIQFGHSDHSVCSPHTSWNISHLYLVKSVQITGKVSQVELIMWTRLYCLVDAKIYKRNEQLVFQKVHSFIASKSTFEFISPDVQFHKCHI